MKLSNEMLINASVGQAWALLTDLERVAAIMPVPPWTRQRGLACQHRPGADFIAFVPFIGGIWLLVLTVMEGTPGPNRFG